MVDALKVAMLGLSGSGKTTYLASMFRKLSIQSKDIGFYIECDDDLRRRELNELYRQLLATEIPKNQVAQNIITRPFTFHVKNGAVSFPALRIEYADYAGELLNVTTVDNKAFIDYLENADVVLAIISGRKIHEHLSGKPIDDLDTEIVNTVQLLNKYALKHPIHFIITMWDLFEDSDTQLQKIKSTLLKLPIFKDFIDTAQEERGRVRLIPVSSYGFNFATLTEGQMCKIPGGIPDPLYMEMPLVCTFRDSFEQKLKDAKSRLDMIMDQPKPMLLQKFSIGDFVKDLLSSITKFGLGFVRLALPRSFENISDEYLQTAIKHIERGEQRRKYRREEEMRVEYDRLQQEQQEAIKLVKDEATAQESVLRSCDKIIIRLEQKFPSSFF